MIMMTGERYDVLITSAGVASAINVISSLRSTSGVDIRIIAGDMDPLAPGLFLADGRYTLPPISSPEYIQDLIRIAAKEELDYIIPIFSKEIELISSKRELLDGSGLKCMVPDPSTLSIVNDKGEFSKWILDNDIPGPAIVDPGDTQFPIFVKPMVGSSSKGARPLYSMDEITRIDPSKYIFQEFVEGTEYTIDFLASREHELMAAVPRERIEVKDGKAVKARTVELKEGVVLLEKIVAELNYQGPGNLQVIDGKNGLQVIELNPRFAAGGLPLATASGPNMPLMLLEMLRDGTTMPKLDYRKGIYMVRYLSNFFLEERNGEYSTL